MPVVVTFAIDSAGRPHAIGRARDAYGDGSQDIVPALAAARFASGAARTGCEIRFTATQATIEEAPAQMVVAATIFPEVRPPRAAYARGFAPDTDCMTPPPEVRLRAYPDFKAIPQEPGTSDWTLVGYDIGASGKPSAIGVRYSSGNAALDRAAVTAVGRSRFEPGKRRGCAYPYWRRGAALAAPVSPEALKVRPAGSTCPIETGWATKPVLRYPTAFSRRRIEGWAVVAFDVAPWGQTGNVRVIAAEPAAAFGDAAMQVIRQATQPPSQGYVGCIERVRYVMPNREGEPETE
ncbi:hypothetical protein ASE75_07330 [Sphingomonas sp. Leaf17]|nr:hypothetical protein ASE75_07330 [Sphingomonas sp. Leaf17]